MSLKLSLHTSPEVPLEAENISPDRLLGLSKAKVEGLPLLHGNEPVSVGDFFRVAGKGNGVVRVEGDLARVKLLGTGMTGGKLLIEGNVGAHLGAAMAGGEITVAGHAGDWVGAEMTAGRIEVKGDAGHMVGSAYRGSQMGVNGGEIIVHGNAGNEIGNTMRNGVIAIGGDCGDFAGVNMMAGTIIVLGRLGWRCGAGMKRGTIVSMHETQMLPTFTFAGAYQPVFLRLYLLRLREYALPIDDAQIQGRYRRWSGDSVALNRGEVLLFEGGESD